PNDSGSGSLRDVINTANLTPEPDTITFAPGLSGPITLVSHLPQITEPLTIIGPGADQITITGASLVAFQATSSVTLDVSGLTLNGMNLGVVGSDTNITLTDMVISSMTTRAVRTTDGSLVMTRVTVTNNNAVSVQSTRTTVT